MAVEGRVLEALRSRTRFADLHWWETIDSTNRWLRQRADEGAPEGIVAVADDQSAGRGRMGRTWEAPPGSGLLASVLLRPAGLDVGRSHLVTAAVALAARAACGAVGGFVPDLKWPNDLLVGDRKLAGVLAEAVDGPGGRAVVVGIGLNLDAAPEGAATAAEVAGRPVGRDDLLLGLLEGLEDRLVAGWDAVAAEHRRACATVGRRVRVELHDRSFDADAVGLDDDGRLLLVDDERRDVAVSAADVVHLRPGSPGSPESPKGPGSPGSLGTQRPGGWGPR